MKNKQLTDSITKFFDILFSLLALLVLLPLLIFIMIVLRFTGEKEMFYFQERIGKGGKPFKIIKFVTMLKNSAYIGTKTVTIKNDPRILPFGKFLRKTKLNELPQLINILKGDMSIIGPRPKTKMFYNSLEKKYKVYISSVKPGLSGIGSIIFRNEDEILEQVKDPIKFDLEVITPYKGELERWFVENRNILLYFQLIILTILVVIFPDKKFYKIWLKDLPNPPKELEKYI